MSAPVFFVVIPLLFALVLLLVRRYQQASTIAAMVYCAILAIIAAIVQFQQPAVTRGFAIVFSPTLTILGRNLTIDVSHYPYVSLIYGAGAIWMLGSLITKVSRLFPAISLVTLALLIAAWSVKPFLFSAILIEIIVLINTVMLIRRGEKIRLGILRFIIFQTLAFPFVLFTGWVLNVAGVNPADQGLLIQAIVFLGLGFGLWLAIFPFYTWVPMLSRDSHPYIVGFILSLLPTVILLLVLEFLNGFAWLRDTNIIYRVLLVCGTLMIATGGTWAAFERNLNRLFGYAVIIETGFALAAISMHDRLGLEYFVMALIPRTIMFSIWATAQATVYTDPEHCSFEEYARSLGGRPYNRMALAFAILSSAGVPLLATFPLRVGLLQDMAIRHPTALWFALVGICGFVIGAGRFLWMAFHKVKSEGAEESRFNQIYFIIGIILLVLLGVLPGLLMRSELGILSSFQYLNW
jgi:NADH-quinone oxidoreductase subunit N